ncbi:MAG TPA: four-carbon acid sugar kinase family protein [Arsenicitalea sp.]|jgi:uncharacterized protein YgbK (DUF1537 family)|nr:four-carbon acid sugar kinase family protein [Arsenicitalea sp.]
MPAPLLAIIADDLTGALDTAVMFSGAGLRTIVPLTLDALSALRPQDWDVIAFPTNTRDGDAGRAGEVTRAAAEALARFEPGLWFKKIDSRLKGHLGPEIAAVAHAVHFEAGLVLPALPRHSRHVHGGVLSGHGIAEPITVSSRFFGARLDLSVPDCTTEADLDALAESVLGMQATTLFIGASSFGRALAHILSADVSAKPQPPNLHGPLLVAIGSRDPVTLAQIGPLLRAGGIALIEAPNGSAPLPAPGNVVFQCVPGDADEDSAVVDVRFAESICRQIAAHPRGTILLTGGNTAIAVLAQCGVQMLQPGIEIAPGVPTMRATIHGREVSILTKSGGFGGPDLLAELFGRLSR